MSRRIGHKKHKRAQKRQAGKRKFGRKEAQKRRGARNPEGIGHKKHRRHKIGGVLFLDPIFLTKVEIGAGRKMGAEK